MTTNSPDTENRTEITLTPPRVDGAIVARRICEAYEVPQPDSGSEDHFTLTSEHGNLPGPVVTMAASYGFRVEFVGADGMTGFVRITSEDIR